VLTGYRLPSAFQQARSSRALHRKCDGSTTRGHWPRLREPGCSMAETLPGGREAHGAHHRAAAGAGAGCLRLPAPDGSMPGPSRRAQPGAGRILRAARANTRGGLHRHRRRHRAGTRLHGLSPSRIACAHLVINAVFNEAVRNKKLAESPCTDIPVPDIVHAADFTLPTDAELEALAAGLPADWAATAPGTEPAPSWTTPAVPDGTSHPRENRPIRPDTWPSCGPSSAGTARASDIRGPARPPAMWTCAGAYAGRKPAATRTSPDCQRWLRAQALQRDRISSALPLSPRQRGHQPVL
jgi:hypothetical protein